MQNEIQNLAAFTKPKKFTKISKFGELILVENEKDKKIFHITEVHSKSLVKNIKKLSSLNLLSGLDNIFSSRNKDFAKLNINEYLINLKIINVGKISLTEPQIAALMKEIFQVKTMLIENGLIEMVISPDLCFLDRKGNFIPVVIKIQNEDFIKKKGLNVFKDIFQILLDVANLGVIDDFDEKNIENLNFSSSFKNFFLEIYNLYKEEINFRIWKSVCGNRVLKVKFKKKILKSIYEEVQLKIDNLGSVYDKSQPCIIIPEEIKWRIQAKESENKKSVVLTSDSSGGSNSRESQLRERFKPCLGGQASQSMENEEKSRIFVKSCEEVISKFIEVVQKESASSFLVNSLKNLEETLKFCELKDPNKTISMLQGILGGFEMTDSNDIRDME